MGKNRSKKNKSSARRELLANEAEHRQSVEETYTKPIHPGQDLKELKDFLSIFYRHIYRCEEELRKLVRQNSVIRQHYERLVPGQISHEDFFQRYLYRCDKQRVLNWEKRHSQREQEKGPAKSLSSALLDDAAEVQVREALRTSERSERALEEGSTGAADPEEQRSKESVKVTEQARSGTQAEGRDTSSEKKNAKASVNEQATSVDAVKECKIPGLSSLASTTVVGDDSISNGKRHLPLVASSSGKDQTSLLKFALLLGGFVMVLFLFVFGAPADNRIKASVCDVIRTDPSTDYYLPWWSPKSWHIGVNSVLCARKVEVLVVPGGQDMEQHKPRQWSALTNKIRWHRRRTQNYRLSNGAVIKEAVDDDQHLHEDAAPRWSLQKWRSDRQKEIAQSQQDVSAISPWSALADKVRGRGWKSKSWGTTDDGDVVCEEQKITVTTEGHSRSSSRGTELATRKQAYVKTVVTEVKTTTIYSPID